MDKTINSGVDYYWQIVTVDDNGDIGEVLGDYVSLNAVHAMDRIDMFDTEVRYFNGENYRLLRLCRYSATKDDYQQVYMDNGDNMELPTHFDGGSKIPQRFLKQIAQHDTTEQTVKSCKEQLMVTICEGWIKPLISRYHRYNGQRKLISTLNGLTKSIYLAKCPRDKQPETLEQLYPNDKQFLSRQDEILDPQLKGHDNDRLQDAKDRARFLIRS